MGFFFCIFFLVSSCNIDDIVLNDENSTETILSEIEFDKGVLVFDSKEAFNEVYQSAVRKDLSVFASDMNKKLYSKNFHSLMPVFTEENESDILNEHLISFQQEGFNLKKSKGGVFSKEDYAEVLDDLEDLFGEEVFASFLNQKGEIIIADEVYKYTDVGLFIFSQKDKEKLYNYLDNKEITQNFMTSDKTKEDFINTLLGTTSRCRNYLKNGNAISNREVISIEEVGARYFSLISCGGGGSSGGGSISGGSGSSNPVTPDEINRALANISPCSVKKPWFSNLFGSVKNCYDQYDGNHRVKIKYFESDYLLAYHVGVKVKHQKKGWTGLWRKQNVSNMVTGINSVTWFYDTSVNYDIHKNYPTQFYVNGDKLYTTISGYYNAVYQGKKNIPLPELPFVRSADVVVELAIDYWTNPFNGKDYDLVTERDLRKYFYGSIFDAAKGVVKKGANKNIRDAVVIMNAPNKLWISYYNLNSECRNCDKLDKTFDWGVATPKIKYKFGADNNFSGSLSFSDFDFNFRKPKDVGLNMYGLAKKNGKWHGSKMVIQPRETPTN